MPKLASSFDAVQRRLEVTFTRNSEIPAKEAILGRLLRHVTKLHQDVSNAVLKRWELNLAEYNALMMLYGTHTFSLSPSQLSEATGEKAANITRLTNGLVERGLVDRANDEDDRRFVVLTLTAKGIELLEEVLPHKWRSLHRQLSHLSSHEQAQLEVLLKKLVAGLDDEVVTVE